MGESYLRLQKYLQKILRANNQRIAILFASFSRIRVQRLRIHVSTGKYLGFAERFHKAHLGAVRLEKA